MLKINDFFILTSPRYAEELNSIIDDVFNLPEKTKKKNSMQLLLGIFCISVRNCGIF
jgi:hypothetical protein